MPAKDFYPIVLPTRRRWACCGNPLDIEAAEEVIRRAEGWALANGHRIRIYESFDYEYDNFVQPKAHVRIWY